MIVVKTTFILLLALQTLTAGSLSSGGVAEWEERFLAIISNLEGDESENAIQTLGDIVGKLSSASEPELSQSPAYIQSKKRLLEIPGVAEFYKQRILEKTDWEMNIGTINGVMDRGWCFHILAEIPRREVVEVLGEFLFDSRDPTNGASSDSPYVPNSLNAVYTLSKIGTKNPPVKYSDARADLDSWKLWYEQVRSGNRSFSFIDQPHLGSITLIDPKLESRNPKKRSRPSEIEELSDSFSDRNTLLMALLAATFVFVVLIGVWRKKRNLN